MNDDRNQDFLEHEIINDENVAEEMIKDEENQYREFKTVSKKPKRKFRGSLLSSNNKSNWSICISGC